MDCDVSDLKQAIIDKLRLNGTLDRIQAELRCAIFLAIESKDDSEAEVDKGKLEQTPGHSIIYHFLKQNRFPATAAVFEKEMRQKIIPLDELKEENTATFCFEFSGDSIILSNSTKTKIEQTTNQLRSTEISNNKMSGNSGVSFISSSLDGNTSEKSDGGKTIGEQQIANFELNRTLKNRLTLNSNSSNGQNEALDKLNLLNVEKRNGKEMLNDELLAKSINDDSLDECNKCNGSNSRSTIFEQQQQQQTSKAPSPSPSNTVSKYITSLSSSTYPRKLPPITPISNELAPSTRLPPIFSLNTPSNRTGIAAETARFSRLLDTAPNSQRSHKSETDEDIMEELIADNLLQSDNSDASISF